MARIFLKTSMLSLQHEAAQSVDPRAKKCNYSTCVTATPQSGAGERTSRKGGFALRRSSLKIASQKPALSLSKGTLAMTDAPCGRVITNCRKFFEWLQFSRARSSSRTPGLCPG
jgi:hypothetical protein